MSGIQFEGREYAFREGETVLEALVKGGAPVNYSCRRGTCQTCILQVEGNVDDVRLEQAILPRARLDAGTFLACQTRATNLSVKRIERNQLFVQARLVDRLLLSADTLRLRLEPPGSFMWHPGQYVNIRHPNGPLRAYAITSLVFTDYWLELHVRCFPGGVVSSYLRDEVRVGDFVALQGPFGNCHYDSTMTQRDLLLIASDIGLGALLGVVREAGLRGHARPMTLYHEQQVFGVPYFADLLRQLQCQYPKLTSAPLLASTPPSDPTDSSWTAPLLPYVGALANTTVFLCGSPHMVRWLGPWVCSQGAPAEHVRGLSFDHAPIDAKSLEHNGLNSVP